MIDDGWVAGGRMDARAAQVPRNAPAAMIGGREQGSGKGGRNDG